jgi:hypothetical protein
MRAVEIDVDSAVDEAAVFRGVRHGFLPLLPMTQCAFDLKARCRIAAAKALRST